MDITIARHVNTRYHIPHYEKSVNSYVMHIANILFLQY